MTFSFNGCSPSSLWRTSLTHMAKMIYIFKFYFILIFIFTFIRELAQLSLQSKRHQQKHIITNINNNIPVPTNPKTAHYVSKYIYNMHHAERGMAVIINNVNFHKSTGMSKRGGSMKDAEALEEVLRKLGFKVNSYTDLTVKKTKAVLNSREFSFAIIFLFYSVQNHADIVQTQVKDREITVHFAVCRRRHLTFSNL